MLDGHEAGSLQVVALISLAKPKLPDIVVRVELLNGLTEPVTVESRPSVLAAGTPVAGAVGAHAVGPTLPPALAAGKGRSNGDVVELLVAVSLVQPLLAVAEEGLIDHVGIVEAAPTVLATCAPVASTEGAHAVLLSVATPLTPSVSLPVVEADRWEGGAVAEAGALVLAEGRAELALVVELVVELSLAAE